jgi:glucosamine kinase
MGFFLGIDGGGSKIECLLADEGGVAVARATGPGANLRRASKTELRAKLLNCFESLRGSAGLQELKPEVVCAGFAGASDAQASAQAREALTELLQPRALYVVGDMEIALEAAVGENAGVVLIAGTGSIAYGRNAEGKTARAGGQGPQEGDEGSGFDIGRRAVEAVLRAQREGRPRRLTHIVLEATGVSSVDELRPWVSPAKAVELAALAPRVVDAARAGDQDASEILARAAAALARLGVAVLQELGLTDTEVRVAASGGVFQASEDMLAQVRANLLAAAPAAVVEPLGVSPAEGAVRLGQRLWLQEHSRQTKR